MAQSQLTSQLTRRGYGSRNLTLSDRFGVLRPAFVSKMPVGALPSKSAVCSSCDGFHAAEKWLG